MSPTVFLWLDRFFDWFHLTLIVFSLFGWLWGPLRRVHLGVLLTVAFSWFILGIWYGIGYCPCTDWHWQVKIELGEKNLPSSYIQYLAERWTGISLGRQLVDSVSMAVFLAVLAISIILNFRSRQAES